MMNANQSAELLDRLNLRLDQFNPGSWSEISQILGQLNSIQPPAPTQDQANDLRKYAQGTAFITFDFGIDGVSVEITKYALTLEDIYRPLAEPSLHMISGNFQAGASSILSDRWSRFQLEGTNGWNKWDGGKWFHALFKAELKPNSPESESAGPGNIQPGGLDCQAPGPLPDRSPDCAADPGQYRLQPR